MRGNKVVLSRKSQAYQNESKEGKHDEWKTCITVEETNLWRERKKRRDDGFSPEKCIILTVFQRKGMFSFVTDKVYVFVCLLLCLCECRAHVSFLPVLKCGVLLTAEFLAYAFNLSSHKDKRICLFRQFDSLHRGKALFFSNLWHIYTS